MLDYFDDNTCPKKYRGELHKLAAHEERDESENPGFEGSIVQL